MQIFLTSATGVVGADAVPRLMKAGHAVTAIGRPEAKRAQLEIGRATAITLNIVDRNAARTALRGYDVLVKLATHTRPSPGRPSAREGPLAAIAGRDRRV